MLNLHCTRSVSCWLFIVFAFVWCKDASASLLWQIEKSGNKNYILGTIHVADKGVMELFKVIDDLKPQPQTLVLEVRQDEESRKLLAERTELQETTLRQLVGRTLYHRIVLAVQERGLAISSIRKLKPWAVALMLDFPADTREPVMDVRLQNRFERVGKLVYSLETVNEQLNVFDQMKLADQVEFLDVSLKQSTFFNRDLALVKASYMKGDIEAIKTLADQQVANVNSPAITALMHRLVDERNQRMFERMQPYLAKSGVLFAVGALHLPGQQGLLDKLRHAGYRLTAIYP